MSRKTTFIIGSRIRHKTDKRLSEGVVVFINEEKDKPYSIHWNNKVVSRGLYNYDEIEKINISSTILEIKKEVENDF